MKIQITLKITLGILTVFLLQKNSLAQEKVNWLSFEEAIALNQKEKKKILVDVYTNWCGWCKKMEASTYRDSAIVNYLNENYYAVKLNAERKDTVRLGDQVFINKNPDGRRSPHDLAISLLNGKMGYPSTVLLDENVQLLNPPISGYLDAKTLEPILHYFGENIHSTKEATWEEYKKNFEGKAK
jgi:thioredoxin-related protein